MKRFFTLFILFLSVVVVAGTTNFFVCGVFSATAANLDESDDFSASIEKLPGENWNANWPKMTKIAEMLPAKIVEETDGKCVYETEHFRFVSTAPIALSAIREIAKIFEGTRIANLALPLNSPCNYYQVAEKGKLHAFLYETRDQYLTAIGAKGTVMENSAGICKTAQTMEDTSIHVPFASLGMEKSGGKYKKAAKKIQAKTLAHELTHFMVNPGVPFPNWFSEGIAEYVGVTPQKNGNFVFSQTKKSLISFVTAYGSGKDSEGGRGLGKKIVSPYSLEEFMMLPYEKFLSSNPQFSYGFSALLVFYFFHLDGAKNASRAKDFIRSCQNKDPEETSYKLLLGNRSWSALEKDFSKGMKSLGISVEFPKH